MYIYSNDNPIMNVDNNGKFLVAGPILIIAGIGAVVATTVSICTKKGNKKAQEEINKVQEKYKDDKRKNEVSEKQFHETLKNNAKSIVKDNGDRKGIDKLLFLRSQVNDGKKYDLKLRDWSNTILEYDGIIMEPQDIGNYNFGYMGRALGIDLTLLQVGAGLNQLRKYHIRTIMNCPTSAFCDDPRDAYFIKLGALKYDEDNK